MENLITKKTQKIEINDIDYMGEYQIYLLFHHFTDIATRNGIEIGLWKQELMKDYGWVVAKQSLHLDEPICYGEEIELSTLPADGTFVSFPRYYFIKKNEKVIGYCSSLWTLIDLHKRCIVLPKRVGIDVPKFDHNITLPSPDSIDIDVPLNYMETRQVRYSDVDTNQHMNNAKYIQWAMDLIDFDIHKENFLSEMTIQYQKEIKPLTQVQLFLGKKDQSYIVQGKDELNDYFLIQLTFSQRK